jgi:hypothetical protein
MIRIPDIKTEIYENRAHSGHGEYNRLICCLRQYGSRSPRDRLSRDQAYNQAFNQFLAGQHTFTTLLVAYFVDEEQNI